MTITQQLTGRNLLIRLNGRLDATWSDYVKETCLDQIRNGHHHLMIDAENLSFLSSAGIRTLIIVAKEISTVKGSFSILKASPFVAKTIRQTGLGQWLTEDLQTESNQPESAEPISSEGYNQQYMIHAGPGMKMEIPACWRPWQPVTARDVLPRSFPANCIALGIGSAAETREGALETLGDFLAVAGHVVYQPPGIQQRPDYLIKKHDFIPEMHVVQLLDFRGEMSHHFRFAPDQSQASFSISTLADKALQMVTGETATLVLLAEIHGLTGASMAQSPGLATDTRMDTFPEIREWITFTGEPVFQGHQCIVCGVVSNCLLPEASLLKPLPSHPGLYGHFHAAVFPYQPLPNGKIDLTTTIGSFFNGPPPLTVLHLIDDQRPILGTGESTFIRGACWCAPVQSEEVLP